MNSYTEAFETAEGFRAEYEAGIRRLIDRKRMESERARDAFLPPQALAANRAEYVQRYADMLGEPLRSYTHASHPPAKRDFVASDDWGDIYRVQIEIFEDFWFYGLLIIPASKTEKRPVPLVLCQHGGGGTPERLADIYVEPKNNYLHIARKLLERGACVFAPQLLLWDKSLFGAPYDRGRDDMDLKQLGLTLTGLEIFCIRRAIDYLTVQPEIDETRIGMCGLSYGGMYTYMTAAIEERILTAYAAGFFNERLTYHWADQVYQNAGNTFLDAEIGALVAPRRLLIEVGKRDAVFACEGGIREFQRLQTYYDACGVPGEVRLNVWDGEHQIRGEKEDLDYFLEKLGL